MKLFTESAQAPTSEEHRGPVSTAGLKVPACQAAAVSGYGLQVL